jgi:hypothetical protein
MGTPETEVTCCPRCKRLVEAKDFMNRFWLGATESILQRINCRCGYNGLPITLSKEDYILWRNQST